MNILITICGRAGSKGVKNKNFRTFYGYPLIEYTLAAAEQVRCLLHKDHVDIAVNSDSEDLLQIASKREGVFTVNRGSELAQDRTPKLPVIQDTVQKIEVKNECKYDLVIDLDITSPFRRSQDVLDGIEALNRDENIDVAFSVVKARRNPYFNMVQMKNGQASRIIESSFTARQEAPEVFDMNASIYCYRRDALMDKLVNSPLEGNFGLFTMKDTGVLDIDCEEDFELMEVLAGHFMKNDYAELYAYLTENF